MSALPPTRPARASTPHDRVRRLVAALALLLAGPGLAGPPGAAAGTDDLATAAVAQATPPSGDEVGPAGDLDFSVERLSGTDRYATAAALSRRFFSPGVPVVLVVTGTNFPDGLSAGPVGDQLGGPVLFATRDRLPEATRAEVARLKPGRILVVGGTSVISETVRAQLARLSTGGATRVEGSDRFATSALLSARAFPGGASIAYVATGRNFPDALAGGAAAGVQGAPMLLTDRTRLPGPIKAELTRLDPDRIMLLGGTSSVSSGVATELGRIATVERIAGTDRYQTALALSRRVFGTNRPGVVLATGRTFPDALAAAPVTRTVRGPILLVDGSRMPSGALAELSRLGPTTAYLAGGPRAVGVPVAKSVQRQLGVCWSGPTYASGTQQVITQVSGTDTKKLAFTLDMGGRLEGGHDIVEWLIENQVCTTLFPTGAMADTTEGRRIMATVTAHPELFEVSNHTLHHCDLVRGGGGSPSAAPCDREMTRAFVRSEIAGGDAVLERLTGMQITPYWRPPYGSHNSFVRGIAAELGYSITVMWNRDTIDWHPDTTTQQIINRTTSPLPPSGSIVLAHLGGYRTGAALPQITSILRSEGYTLTTVSDMRDG